MPRQRSSDPTTADLIAAAVRAGVAEERERCAKVIEEIPSSASLYENTETARAVTAFKKHAVSLIRSDETKALDERSHCAD